MDPVDPTAVVVVEDDLAIRRGIVDALRFAGHRVEECGDGAEALELVSVANPDLVLLDVMLPSMDGMAVLERLRRQRPGLPVIMVTALGSEDDRVRGLTEGADDYVVKPFSAKELLARVAAVLRRSPERPKDLASFDVEGRRIDLERRELTMPDGERRRLSEREAALLAFLARRAGRPATREELLERVWGLDPRGLQTRTVDMHVSRLRDKLGDDRDEPRIIVTLRARGYMLGEGIVVTPR